MRRRARPSDLAHQFFEHQPCTGNRRVEQRPCWPATVILDDALALSNDDRLERMFDILRAGEKRHSLPTAVFAVVHLRYLAPLLAAVPRKIAGR